MTTPDPAQVEQPPPFQVEVTIAAPADTVWQAFRDKDELRRWHGWDFDDLDAEIAEIFFTDVSESGDAGARRLVVNGGDAFDVVEQANDTLVRLTRAARDPDDDWDAYYEDINEGWISFLQQLRFALERHHGADRQTVNLTGTRTAATPPGDLLGQLGVDAIADRPVGGRYELTLADEHVTGDVWFRSDHQIGLTVDSWGEGLLVAATLPSSPSNPDGGATMTLTSYGLTELARADLERRWTAWWQDRFSTEAPAD